MHPHIARITELSGPDVAARISAEFGGQTIHLPLLACDANESNFVEQAIEDAYKNEMRRLMAGALEARSPEDQREWLATAQQLLALRQSALDWHASRKTTCAVPPAPQPSAASPIHSPVLPS